MNTVFTNELVAATSNFISEAKSIVITAHRNPDGDAIGSTLGLMHFLKSLGKDALVMMPDAYPHFLNWIPGQSEVVRFEDNPEAHSQSLTAADLIFVLDYNHLGRVAEMGEVIAASSARKVVIDHHQQPDDFADVLFSDTKASSTCEMVYELADAMNKADQLSAEAVTCLYCGIVTDSGSFRFPGTTPRTHRIVANLMELGAEPPAIHQAIFDTNRYDRLRLLGYVLDSKMNIYPEYRAVIMRLEEEELDRFNFQKGDTEGFVNYGLSIQDIVLAIFITHRGGKTKMSFRSKGSFSVNEFARAHYNGGGHNNAAGGISPLSVEETVAELESYLPQYREGLLSS